MELHGGRDKHWLRERSYMSFTHAPLSLALRGVIEAALAGRSLRVYSAGLGEVGWGVWSGLVAIEYAGELACVGSCFTWYWLGPGLESGEDGLYNNTCTTILLRSHTLGFLGSGRPCEYLGAELLEKSPSLSYSPAPGVLRGAVGNTHLNCWTHHNSANSPCSG